MTAQASEPKPDEPRCHITIHIELGLPIEPTEYSSGSAQQDDQPVEETDKAIEHTNDPAPRVDTTPLPENMVPSKYETPGKTKSTSPEKVDSAKGFGSDRSGSSDTAAPATAANTRAQRKAIIGFVKERTKERQANKDINEGWKRQEEYWSAVADEAAHRFDVSRGCA